jgi:RNA polymerase sigma-70 factor (ECF subfamily)
LSPFHFKKTVIFKKIPEGAASPAKRGRSRGRTPAAPEGKGTNAAVFNDRGRHNMDRQQEEQVVIARVRRGERAAFAVLVDAYAKPIFNLAFRMTGSRQDADDLAQETFLRAYRKLKRFDPEKKFFTWLYTIALNIIRNHLKSSPERTARIAEMNHPPSDPVDPANPEGLFLDREKAQFLEICLQKLPSELKEAVVLRYYQDLSFDEIATITDASVSAVKMRVYRGLDQLKQLMNK